MDAYIFENMSSITDACLEMEGILKFIMFIVLWKLIDTYIVENVSGITDGMSWNTRNS